MPSGKSKYAKPKSMDMPRSFSSFNLSVSIPVSDLIREVLPWSICPAVPIINGSLFMLEGKMENRYDTSNLKKPKPDHKPDPVSLYSYTEI